MAPAAADRAGARPNALLVDRLRASLWAYMIANGVFAIELLLRKGLAVDPIHIPMLIATLPCVIALRALRHPRYARRAVLIALTITSAACFQAAAAAVIDSDATTLVFSFVVITIGAAALLPWGPWAQTGLIAVAAATAACSGYVINGSVALIAGQSVLVLQVLIALAVSLAVAYQFDAYRRAIERRNAALAASAERYRALAENVTDVIARLTPDGTLHYVSPAVRWLGYTPPDLVGHTLFDFIHPDEVVATRAAFTAGLAATGTSTLSFRLCRADGVYKWVELSSRIAGRPARGASGEILAVMRNIDERHHAQDALRRSEQHFRALIENSLDMISVIDPEGVVRYRSPSNMRALGYGEDVAAQLTPFELLHLDDRPELLASLARIRATPGATETFQGRFRHADGSWHVIEGTATNLLHDPAVAGLVVNSRDITERTQFEAQLRQAEGAAEAAVQHLAAIVECSEDAIVGGGPDGTIMSWNRAAERLYGYTASEVKGRSISIIYPPDQSDEGRRIVERIRRGAVIKQDDTVRMRKDGSRVSVSVTLSPITNAAGTVVGASAISRDITARKCAEVELQQAKEDAEAANRSKSEFLANMSHEIRTPMNGIIGMTELTLNTALSAEQREYLGMVRSSADSLLTVVNDILDFSKVDAGKLELDAQDFNVRECLGDTLKALGLRAATSGLELVCRISPEIPAVLIGDAGRLRQVLVNLVGNAIKFTAQGEVAVHVGVEFESRDRIDLHVAVTDTGIGIPAAKRQAIFQPFEQADGSTTRHYGGTGLGLAISGRLVALMGGWIWAESELGRGSTFHFTAQFGVSPRSTERQPPAALALRSLPVLIVDDNATSRRALHEMLSDWQLQPVAAAGGVAGLNELQRATALGKPYPLVLLDAHMPDMDGFALAERIQQTPGLAATTIMLLSSADLPGDMARCRALGVGTHLTKPIKQSELLEAMLMAVGYVRPNAAAVAPVSPPTPEPVRPLRVLLAEDNPVNQKLGQRLLEKRGHRVALAGNGAEALAALRAESFDLVLMDVQMPEMDGLEATAAIRAHERASGAHVPIIAITAHAMKDDRERCRAAGMDGYVSKPISAQRLFDEIARVVPSVCRQRDRAA